MVKKLLLILLLACKYITADVQSPDDFFNLQLGSDRTLVDWQQITQYCNYIAENSPRVVIQELGKTTLNNTLFLLIISSEQTMHNIDYYKEIQKRLAYPYHLSEQDQKQLINTGKAVVLVSMNIHSIEIGSSQLAPELLYELATSHDPKTKLILDNSIILLIPSLNPDGQQMVVDWYRKNVNSSFEGSPIPWLYHYYAGHDNNRDWHYFNLKESQLVARILYNQWFPQVVFDQHQMGSRGPRIFLPPYANPVNPNVPALLTAQVNALGKKIVSDLHDSGFKGVATGTIFNAYFQGTMSKTPLWHNMVGILCEVASCRIATPLFFPYGSLSGFGPDLPEYKQQSNFLDPWPGGWWRLRDILNIEKTTFYSMLDFVARYREIFIQNFLQLNQENIKLGKVEKPFGYLISQNQHDPSNMNLMLQKLHLAGVEIQKLDTTLSIGNSNYEPGTYYISSAQPARNYIKDIMEIQNYPELRLYPDGPPLRPYDVTTWNLPLQMDVHVSVNKEIRDVSATELDTITNCSKGRAEGMGRYIYFSAQYNWCISLALKFLDQGLKIYQLAQMAHFEDKDIVTGSFLIDNQNKSDFIVKELTSKGIDVYLHDTSPRDLKKLHAANIGIYQPYTANIDEGWTRWVLDCYKIPYHVLRNEDIISGDGLKKVNILIFASMTTESIMKGLSERSAKDKKIGDYRIRPEFAGGIGKKGVKNLFNYAQSGGRLVFLDRSTSFAADSLHLPVQIVNRDMERSKFYIPGALVKLTLDEKHYITSGMKDCCNVFFSSHTPLFQLMPHTDVVYTPAIFAKHHIITSGWGLGEKLLSDRVALIDIPLGAGNVILYGFRPQHRGQTFATFKLLFNAFILY
jgi:hypothetical protein